MALSTPTHHQANSQVELDDHYLVALAKDGRTDAYDTIIRRYRGFVRLKASSYFLLGGEPDDLIQEGLVGLYKAIRDYRTDRESSFRNFAELCITRQIITAVKTATRNKHTPLNQYVSFSQTPAAAGESDTTLDEILPGPAVHDPVNQVIASEELGRLSEALAGSLSQIERHALFGIAGGTSYEVLADEARVSVKTIDNAAQRAKRKVAEGLMPAERPEPSRRPSIHDKRAEQVVAFVSRHPAGVSPKQIMEALDLAKHQWQGCRPLVEERVRFAGSRRERLFFPPAPVAA